MKLPGKDGAIFKTKSWSITNNIFFSWGLKKEATAVKEFQKLIEQQKNHSDIKITESGLHISKEHPFLGASPDRIWECECHGTALVEVKCPFSQRKLSVQNATKEPSFF